MCLSGHSVPLDCRLLSSDIVQLDVSVTCLTFDQSAIASGEISIESKFGLCDPLAQLDQEVDDDEDDHRSGQDADTSSGD